jgi:hypothetical protein
MGIQRVPRTSLAPSRVSLTEWLRLAIGPAGVLVGTSELSVTQSADRPG